jgi:hypothetical protein
VDPRDHGECRIEDERDAQCAPPPTVEQQVPRRDALAFGTLDRLYAKFRQPCIDALSG